MVGDVILQHTQQTRLAKPCFTDQQDNLACPFGGQLPALLEQPNFSVATDQRCHGRFVNIHTAGRTLFREHAERLLLSSNASNALPSETLAFKESIDEPMCTIADQHGITVGHWQDKRRHTHLCPVFL